jgi:translation initiation factor 2A
MIWSDDEKVFATSHSTGIRFYEAKDSESGEEVMREVEFPKMAACCFRCLNNTLRFCVICDEEPRKMKIFEYPDLEHHKAYRPVVKGTVFYIKMNASGSTAIAVGGIQASEELYMGETFAYYLNTQNRQKFVLKKAGPIHCIEFSPGGDKIVTIAGHVPPDVALHYDKVGTTIPLGELPLNSVKWSCSGNLIALGGFGAFNGELRVVDSQTRTMVAQGEAPYTSDWGWSPCGRLLMSAVMFPKMVGSNEFRIFNHGCQLVTSVKMTELTQCEWVGLEDPMPLPKLVLPVEKKAASGAYVPPHLRKGGSGTGPPGLRGPT